MLTVHPKLVPQPHQLGAALHHHRPSTTHRRNPSAPTLSVQPTNVPGLFSLGPSRASTQVAKAAREPRQPKQQQQQQQSQSRSGGGAAGADSSSKSSAPAKSDTAAKAVDTTPVTTPPTTPAPASQSQQRGRKATATAAKSGNSNSKRSTSQQAQSRRNKEHQPDPAADPRSTTPPPPPKSATAAAAADAKDAHTSPRSKRPTHQRNNTAPTSPIVPTAAAATPAPPAPTVSGKAARRRNRKSGAAGAGGGASSEDEQTPQVIKIAASKKDPSAKQLSRSAPQAAAKIARGAAIADWDTPLTLDIKSVPTGLASGPRTAPLDAAPRFPFGDAYSPPASPTPPNKHTRSPSVPMNGAMFDMEDDFHVPLVTKSAGSSPNVPSARRFKVPGSVPPLTASVTMPALSMLGMNSAANMSAPGDLDHPASSNSMDPRFRWASSSFQTGPATRGLPAPGL